MDFDFGGLIGQILGLPSPGEMTRPPPPPQQNQSPDLIGGGINAADQLIYGRPGPGMPGITPAGERPGQLGGQGGPPPGSPAPGDMMMPGNPPMPMVEAQPFGERVDRLDQRQLHQVRLRDGAVVMHLPRPTGAPQAPPMSSSQGFDEAGFRPPPAGNPNIPPQATPAQFIPPPSPQQQPWLGQTMGAGPDQMAQMNQRRQMMSGIGAGLKSVGQNWNKPAMAAFAGSAGSGIEGADKSEQQQRLYDIQKLNSAIRLRMQEAQIPWYQARTEVLKLKQNQDASSRAWQLSDPGKYHMVENEVKQQQAGLLAMYRDELKQASLMDDKEKMDKIRGIIDKGVQDFRNDRYKKYGLDPAKADDAMKRGFEGTEEQIRHLKPGTRFWDSKVGGTRIRGADKHSTPVTEGQTQAAQPNIGDLYGQPQ